MNSYTILAIFYMDCLRRSFYDIALIIFDHSSLHYFGAIVLLNNVCLFLYDGPIFSFLNVNFILLFDNNNALSIDDFICLYHCDSTFNFHNLRLMLMDVAVTIALDLYNSCFNSYEVSLWIFSHVFFHEHCPALLLQKLGLASPNISLLINLYKSLLTCLWMLGSPRVYGQGSLIISPLIFRMLGGFITYNIAILVPNFLLADNSLITLEILNNICLLLDGVAS